MTLLSELREEVFEAAGGWCSWPQCDSRAEELAHIKHRGMGGNPLANVAENVLAFCRTHHQRYDEARLTPNDLNNLLNATWRQGGCAFPSCHDAVETMRQVLPDPHVSWHLFQLCVTHARVTDLSKPCPGRRSHIQTLLRELKR